MNKSLISGLAAEMIKTAQPYSDYVERLRVAHETKWAQRYEATNRHDARRNHSMLAAMTSALSGFPLALAAGAGLVALSPAATIAAMGAGLGVGVALVGKAVYHGMAKDAELKVLNETYYISDEKLVADDQKQKKAEVSLWDKTLGMIRRGGNVEHESEDQRHVARDAPAHRM